MSYAGHYYYERFDQDRGQAEQLMPMIERCIGKAGTSYGAIDALLCSVGPGAFTGLRVGLSATKALSMALNMPLYGYSSLQSVAWDYAQKSDPDEAFYVVLETKRAAFYVQKFSKQAVPMEDAQVLLSQGVVDCVAKTETVFVGDCVQRLKKEISECVEAVYCELLVPDLKIVVERFVQTPDLFLSDLSPRYLCPPDVSQPKKQGRKIQS